MKRRFLTVPLLLVAALFLTVWASAGEAAIEIANRRDAEGAFSCDVSLTGEATEGSLFVAAFAESEQMKRVAVYPAAETVGVSLPDVAATDYIKIMWLDGRYMPLSSPVLLRMSGNGSEAYAKFAEDFLKLQNEYGGAGGAASGAGDPYILARLLVSCNELPDLSGHNVVAMIQGPDNLYVLQFNTAGEARACAEYLRGFSSVRYAEPDSIAYADGTESDASAPLSWGAEAAGLAEYAENLVERGINHAAVVAVVDSGADVEHEFLRGRLLPGYDFIDGDEIPQDGFGHGTHVTGAIADCTPGLDVKIMPVRVLDDAGAGSASHISAGIRYAADHGANVINLSLGLTLGHSSYVEEAVAYALSKNITVVVAAGNQNTDVKWRCPAHIADCITVAAVDRDWKRFELSNYGEGVDIAAPGVSIQSSLPGGGYGEMSGTSMAAPHVSAAAALLMEERGTAQTPAQISRALRDSAASLDASAQMSTTGDLYFGAGFLNLNPFIIHPQRVIRFHANADDATGRMEPQSAASGSLTALKANAFSRDGYEFAGWNTKPDASGDAYADGATLAVSQNLSLYAQWKPESVLYALLYADGELVFQNGNAPNPEKTLVQSYAIPAAGAGGEYAKWHDRRADIQTVTFAEVVRPVSTALWFYGCENLTEVRGAENLDAAGVTNMGQMFARCKSLATLDLSAWNTGSVTSMRQMFFQCGALNTIYASDAFDVSNVENSDDMFLDCASLPNYDPAHTGREYARIGTASAPGYFTDKNASNDIYAVLYADGELVFQNNARTESGRNVTEVYKVTTSDNTPWNPERANITSATFADRIQPASTANWFSYCRNLTNIRNIENLSTFRLTDMSHMFQECNSLVNLDVSGFDTSSVTTMTQMFDGCGKLSSLNVSGWDTSNVTLMNVMFRGCSSLSSLDVSNWNISNVSYMNLMFDGCNSLTNLNLSNWDTANVRNMYRVFHGCSALQQIYASSLFVTDNISNSDLMFSGCSSLVGGAGTKYDNAHTGGEYARIDGGPDSPGYFTLNLSAEELFHLGEDYFNGANGKPKDYAQSVYYYQKSADRGNMYAINDLGYMYQNGYGVARDYDKAFALYSQAADMGNPHALNNLGYMYENGYGVAQSYQKALDYYQRASDAGSSMAAANLAALRILMMFL